MVEGGTTKKFWHFLTTSTDWPWCRPPWRSRRWGTRWGGGRWSTAPSGIDWTQLEPLSKVTLTCCQLISLTNIIEWFFWCRDIPPKWKISERKNCWILSLGDFPTTKGIKKIALERLFRLVRFGWSIKISSRSKQHCFSLKQTIARLRKA